MPVRDLERSRVTLQIVKADIGRTFPIGMAKVRLLLLHATECRADDLDRANAIQRYGVLRPGGIPTESHVGIRSKWSPNGNAIAFVKAAHHHR